MQEPSADPGLFGNLLIWATAFFTWATGEVGRVFVAGAAGGLLQWFMQEKRRLLDGVIAVGAGAICAHYLNWLVAAILAVPFGPISDKATTGFIAGLVGMSFAKIIIAVVNARARSFSEPGDGTS